MDDLIIAASCDDKLSKVKASSSSRFKMKDMGELHFCLGVSIDYDAEKKCILMHQKQYILQMLERYGLMEAKTCATPFNTSVNLQKSEKEEVDTKNQANYQRWSRGHKARGQGQGYKKNPRPRPRTAFPRTDTLEAKDRSARGQGPRTQAQVLSKKKKKRSSQKFFK